MNPDLTRSVLIGLAGALPAEGQNVLTGIDMRTGWGGIIFVTIRSDLSPLGGRDGRRQQVRDGGSCSAGCRTSSRRSQVGSLIVTSPSCRLAAG